MASSAAPVQPFLNERGFRAYFLAAQSSLLGSTIESVAIGWQIFSLRHSAFDLGMVGLTLFLPQLMLALPAGVLADRLDRRRICLGATAAEIAALLLFVALVQSRSEMRFAYFGAIALVGCARAVAVPAERALLVGVVAPSSFVRATALTTSVEQLVRVAGPVLGGGLIAVSATTAFAAAAVSFAVTSLGLFLLPAPRVEKRDREKPERRSAMDGIRFILNAKIILGAISLDLFAVLFGGAIALLPIYAVQILDVGPAG